MKFSQPKNFSFFNSAFFGKLLLFFFTVLILLFLWAAFWTGRSLQNFSAGQFAKAGRQARYALWAVQGESWLTFQQSDSLFIWQDSLHILAELPNLQTVLNIVWKKHQVFSKATDLFLKSVQAEFTSSKQ